MDKSKIEWCDSTWNLVTGCLHGCEYCYARKIAERFGGCWRLDLPPDISWRGNVGERGLVGDYARHSNGKCHVLDEPEIECAVFNPPSGYRGKVKPYPYYFDPTFHRYKLDEPQRWKKPRNIFVCSMADLFGEWVPNEWIEQVFAACEAAPQHNYLFLTKNPKRYGELAKAGKLPKWKENWWFGSTIDSAKSKRYPGRLGDNTFVSIEPLTERLDVGLGSFGSDGWIIIGAETGNRKGKVTPKKEWIDTICNAADITHTPVFMKDSLIPIVGEQNMRRELPPELRR